MAIVSETIPYFMFLIYIETPDLLQNLCAAPVSTVTWWKNRISLLDVIFRLIIDDFSLRTFECERRRYELKYHNLDYSNVDIEKIIV